MLFVVVLLFRESEAEVMLGLGKAWQRGDVTIGGQSIP